MSIAFVETNKITEDDLLKLPKMGQLGPFPVVNPTLGTTSVASLTISKGLSVPSFRIVRPLKEGRSAHGGSPWRIQ